MDEASKIIDEKVRNSEDDIIKNNYRSPAARKELNKYISQITISNSLQNNSNGNTNSISPKFAYKKDISTGDINHTKQNKNILIIPNGTTIYSNTIHVEHRRKQYSNQSNTHNGIPTIDVKNNKAISKQNNIQ